LRITVGKAKDKKSPRGRGRPKFAESEERFQIDELDTIELLNLPPRVEALTLALYWASLPETRNGKRMEPLRVPACARYAALEELGLERPGDELKLALEPLSRYASAVLAHLPREWDATGEDAAFHARLTSEQRLIRNRRRGLSNAAL